MTRAKPKRKPAKRRPAPPRFYGPGELTDLEHLPKRFDLLSGEVRDGFRLFGDRILPTLVRVEENLASLNGRVAELEQWRHRVDDDIAALRAAQNPPRDVAAEQPVTKGPDQ